MFSYLTFLLFVYKNNSLRTCVHLKAAPEDDTICLCVYSSILRDYCLLKAVPVGAGAVFHSYIYILFLPLKNNINPPTKYEMSNDMCPLIIPNTNEIIDIMINAIPLPKNDLLTFSSFFEMDITIDVVKVKDHLPNEAEYIIVNKI